MKKLGEEVAYLRGLAEGLDIDDKSKEGKMIGKIVEILGCFADKVEELEYSVGDLEDQVEELEYEVEELQQEVEDLEEWLYDEDDYDDEDYDDEYDEDEDILRYEEEEVFPDDLFFSFYYYSLQVLLLCKPLLDKNKEYEAVLLDLLTEIKDYGTHCKL